MKIKKDKYDGRYYLTTKRFLAHFKNDWSQIFGKYNWISMNFLQLYFEDDKMTGHYEFEFMVLGLGFRMSYHYNQRSSTDIIIEKYEKERKSKKGKKNTKKRS